MTTRSPSVRLASDTAPPTTYTCPMHPEVQQQGPGRCPKCKMFLVPKKPS